MILSNLYYFFEMMINPKVWKFNYKFLKLYSNDKNFSLINLSKAILNSIKCDKVVKFENRYVISSFLPSFPSRAFLSLINANEDDECLYTKQMNAIRNAPISMFLCLTSKCNYECEHCSMKNRDINKDLTVNEWINVIKQLQNMGVSIIGLTGGEPLLVNGICKIVKSIDKRSKSFLFTNGSKLSLKKAKMLKRNGLDVIGISLDSFNKQKFNKFRNIDNAYENAIEAVKNAKKAGLYVILQFVLEKKSLNYRYILDYMKKAKKLRVNEVRILEPILSGKYLELDRKYIYTNLDRERLIAFQKKINSRMFLPKLTTFAYTENESQYGCGAGTQHSYISASGELFPCDFVPITYGNVKNSNLKEKWNKMNKEIGIPKCECIAQKLRKQISNKKNSEGIVESKNINLKSIGKIFPKFYRLMQGK